MRKRLLIAAVALTVLTVTPPALAQTGWMRWEGRYFIVWLPDKQWRVVESASGVDISSPTGTATVGHAYATSAPRAFSLGGVRGLVLSSAGGLRAVRITRSGAPYSVGGVATGQKSDFTAVRTRDSAKIRGIVTAQVFGDAYSGYGMAAYVRVAPAAQWERWAATLAIVERRIVNLGRG